VADEEPDPGQTVLASVDRVLELAATWLAWDGKGRIAEGGDRIYTPHKAIRRHTDHLIDHLAEVDDILGGRASIPDAWHGSLVTLAADWSPFTEADLREANERLTRLAEIYRLRLRALGPREWDRRRGEAWTIREIVEHVAPAWYAEQVGDLSTRAG
jgi:hypothetical protein